MKKFSHTLRKVFYNTENVTDNPEQAPLNGPFSPSGVTGTSAGTSGTGGQFLTFDFYKLFSVSAD